MPLRLRRGMPSDLPAILALEQSLKTAPHWPASVYAAMLQEQGAGAQRAAAVQRCVFVAEAIGLGRVTDGTGMAGFSVGAASPGAKQSESTAELESVAVSSRVRRNGVGHALCLAVIEWCRERDATGITLEVRASSDGAIALYERLGFIRTGLRPHYYREPEEDALLFKLSLR